MKFQDDISNMNTYIHTVIHTHNISPTFSKHPICVRILLKLLLFYLLMQGSNLNFYNFLSFCQILMIYLPKYMASYVDKE